MDKQKLAKQKLIKSEIKKLTDNFKQVDADKKVYTERLINQAAFMYATLIELQDAINLDGTIELFQNGAQQMLREHPAVKAYNTMIKNYISIVKQLIELTPQANGKEDVLLNFLEKKPK